MAPATAPTNAPTMPDGTLKKNPATAPSAATSRDQAATGGGVHGRRSRQASPQDAPNAAPNSAPVLPPSTNHPAVATDAPTSKSRNQVAGADMTRVISLPRPGARPQATPSSTPTPHQTQAGPRGGNHSPTNPAAIAPTLPHATATANPQRKIWSREPKAERASRRTATEAISPAAAPTTHPASSSQTAQFPGRDVATAPPAPAPAIAQSATASAVPGGRVPDDLAVSCCLVTSRPADSVL